MAHFPKTTAVLTLALPLLAASTTLSADTKYSGHELIRGLYIAAGAQSGPVAQDYFIAREMLYLEKDDGTKVFMTQYDFSPMWNVRPYLYDSDFPSGARSTFENGHADPTSFGPETASMYEQLKEHLPDLYAEDYNKLLLCNQMGNDFYEGQDSFFKDPNGPDCQLYEAVPSLGNLVAEKSTMELMQYDFDQEIGAIVSNIGVSGDQIRISLTGFDRQTKRMKKGFNGWADWMERSQSIGTSSKPKVTCNVPASSAGALSELVPGSVLMVRASVVSLDANAAVFDCTPV